MSGTKNIGKNTVYYTSALVVQKIIAFIYFSIIAARLGADDIGKYFFALSFATIFTIMVDFGLINVLIRNIANDYQQTQKLFSLNLTIKIPLAVLSYGFLILLAYLFNYSPELRQMIVITGVIMIIDSFTLTFYGLFRAYHNLFIESLGTLFTVVIQTATGLFILTFYHDPKIQLIAILVASIVNFIYSYLNIKIRLKLKTKFIFVMSEIKTLLKTTFPFALAGIFTKIYAYIDTLLLSIFSTTTALGFYSIPYKMTFALQFIPMAFIASLYPIFSFYYQKDEEKLAFYYKKSLYYLSIIILPLAIGTICLAQPLILKIYGKTYMPSVFSLQILMAGLIFVFLNFPASYLLNACLQQKRQTINLMFITALNITLNLILIKFYNLSFIGASFASSISSVILFFLNFYYGYKLVKFNLKLLLLNYAKLLSATAIMAIVVIFLTNKINLYYNVIIAMAVYLLLIFLTKSLSLGEIRILFKSLLKKPNEKDAVIES